MINIEDINLKQIFSQVINKQQPIFTIKSKFANIMKDQSNLTINIPKEEIVWLMNNIDCIERIIESKKATSIIWCLYKYKECYAAEIARLTRNWTNTVNHWLKNLKKKTWLIEERQSSFSNDRIFFHLSKTYSNIINTLILTMKDKYGEAELNKLVTPDMKNGEIVDKQYNAIKKIRDRKFKIKNTSHLG